MQTLIKLSTREVSHVVGGMMTNINFKSVLETVKSQLVLKPYLASCVRGAIALTALGLSGAGYGSYHSSKVNHVMAQAFSGARLSERKLTIL